MNRRRLSSPVRRPRGMSMIGLMAWAIIVGFIGYIAVRVFPTVNEYLTIQRAVNRVAAESPTTVGEVRKAFDRQKEIEYSISSITGKDLKITKEDDRVVIRFAYDKQIELMPPAYLLIKYEGQSRPAR